MKIIFAITQDIEHVEQNFQVVTYSIVCIGHNIIIMTLS